MTTEMIIVVVLAAVCAAVSIVTLVITLLRNGSRSERILRESLDDVRRELTSEMRENRKENTSAVSEGIKSTAAFQGESMRKMSQEITTSLESFRKSVSELTQNMEGRMENLRGSVDKRLSDIQTDNQKKLDEIRTTVDEKLQKTLEDRVGQSFKVVSERLEQVYKGLGEMQTLASGVGDLKKALSNVKVRGNLGEIQLSRILDQVMTPSQYCENVVTKHDSKDPVEFAIKLPGKDENGDPVLLPIDSKFPTAAYTELVDAYEASDQEGVERASKALETIIKKCAKDIFDKYIDPPNTTDFAVMFLPFEGLYAEVVRRSELIEELQRKYHINVTGPTTITALLNSIQMGFKTLALEKRSAEVWELLSAVKTEFGNFGKALESAQKRIEQAGSEIDTLVGVRTRKIIKSLRSVEEMPETQAKALIDGAEDGPDDEEE